MAAIQLNFDQNLNILYQGQIHLNIFKWIWLTLKWRDEQWDFAIVINIPTNFEVISTQVKWLNKMYFIIPLALWTAETYRRLHVLCFELVRVR